MEGMVEATNENEDVRKKRIYVIRIVALSPKL